MFTNLIESLTNGLWLLASGLIVVFASTITEAQLLEEIDAETGDWSQWRAKVSGTENHKIVSDPVCAGNYAYQWTHTGSRTESAAEYHPVDTDLWYGFAMYLSPNFSTERNQSSCVGGASVAQIHGYHPQCPEDDRAIAMLRIDDGQFKWWLKGMGNIRGCYERLAPADKGEWLHFVVNTKLTTGGDGYFKCWLNGELILEQYGSSWSSCRQGAYFKMGTYASAREGDWMLGDEIRVGRSREVVDPANYCGTNAPDPIAVTGVSIANCPNASVGVGSQLSLSAQVLPAGASDPTVVWTSSDASVATVDQQGMVRTLSEGSATIQVATSEGNFTDQCLLAVSRQGPCAGSNLARGGQVVSYSGQQEGNPVTNLLDGQQDTDANRWSVKGYPQWVIVDLGSEQPIGGSVVRSVEERDYEYEVYASTSLAGVEATASRALVGRGRANTPVSFAAVEARYVRLQVVGASNYTGDWISLREWEVLGSCADSPESPADGAGSVVVRAQGDCGSEVMELHVDGSKVKEWTVSTTMSDYVYEGFAGGEVSVHLVNDALQPCDRNLTVDYLSVCGSTYQTEQAATKTSTCCPNNLEKLFTNGDFNFGGLVCSSGSVQGASATLKGGIGSEARVYPNPAESEVVVEGPVHYQVQVYDLEGRPLQQSGTLSGRTSLDVSSLRPGVYLLQLTDTGTQQTFQQRLIVE